MHDEEQKGGRKKQKKAKKEAKEQYSSAWRTYSPTRNTCPWPLPGSAAREADR